MADHPLFETLPMAEAQLLDPGDTLSEVEDIVASTVGCRAMFWVYAFTGDQALADEENGIYNARCDGGCVFGTHSGDLQSRMMTSAKCRYLPPYRCSSPLWRQPDGWVVADPIPNRYKPRSTSFPAPGRTLPCTDRRRNDMNGMLHVP